MSTRPEVRFKSIYGYWPPESLAVPMLRSWAESEETAGPEKYNDRRSGYKKRRHADISGEQRKRRRNLAKLAGEVLVTSILEGSYNSLPKEEAIRHLGGKAHSLQVLNRLIPRSVPPWFVVTTGAHTWWRNRQVETSLTSKIASCSKPIRSI